MKLHKIFMLLLTVILLMSVLSVLCSAKSPSELAKEYAAEYSDEMEAINEFVGDKADTYANEIAATARFKDGQIHEKAPFLVNADTAYPYYFYKNQYAAEYTDFASHIERYAPGYWIVENENGFTYFYKDGGKLIKGSSGGKTIYTDRYGKNIDISFSINGVAEYLNDKFNSVDEYKVMGYPYTSSGVVLIYVRSEDKDYLIPFYRNPDWADFDNGKVYTLEELLPILDPTGAIGSTDIDSDSFKLNSDQNSSENQVNYGGGGEAVSSTESDASQQNNNRSNIVIYIVAGVILLVIIAGITVITVKHKKS